MSIRMKPGRELFGFFTHLCVVPSKRTTDRLSGEGSVGAAVGM